MTQLPVPTSGGPYPTTPTGQFQPPPKPSAGLAVVALILGIIAFLTGLVPILGVVLGAGALVLGVLALNKGQSKGMSITGMALGGVAALSSIVMTIALIGASMSPNATTANADAPLPVDTSSAAPATTPKAAEPTPKVQKPTPKPTAAKPAVPKQVEHAGTAADPLPQPYIAKGILGGAKYKLTASIFNSSANAQVNAWNEFNDKAPAGFKYVIVKMTMTGIDKDGVEPSLATLDMSLATSEGNKYDSQLTVLGDGMSSMDEGPKLYPGNSFTGYDAYVVPNSAKSFLLYDNGNYITLK